MRNKITCMIGAYNESARIRTALEGLAPWADEIVVYDKGSTDGTQEIARSVSPNVRVIQIPYSDRGCEDMGQLIRESRNDWIYWTTCSEVPTRQIVVEMDRLIASKGSGLDVIRVPRKIHSMGAYRRGSPWRICYYPFLFHRERVVLPGRLHDHFRASSPKREESIVYRPDVCVHHYTHASFDSFVKSQADYAVNEAGMARPDEHFFRLRRGLTVLLDSLCHDRTTQAHGMGYAMYSMMVALKLHEIETGGPWQKMYAKDAASILGREWGGAPPPAAEEWTASRAPPSSDDRLTLGDYAYRFVVRVLVACLCWVAVVGAKRKR